MRFKGDSQMSIKDFANSGGGDPKGGLKNSGGSNPG